MDALKIYQKIRQEKNQPDKPFKHIEFNIRDEFIVMNVLYDSDLFIPAENHHTYRHDLDPEFLNHDTYLKLVEILKDRGVPYVIRRDEFI